MNINSINKIALPISVLAVTVLSFLLARSCSSEDYKKADKYSDISFKVSNSLTSERQRLDGIAGQDGRLELAERFPGQGKGQGSTLVPMATVKIPEGTKFEVDVPAREYSVSTEVKVSGKEVTANSEMKITVNDKVYSVPVKTTVSKVEVKQPSRWQLDTNLYLGLSATSSLNEFKSITLAPTLGISFLSWKSIGEPPTVVLGAVALGYDIQNQKPTIELKPVLINLNCVIPVIKNSYLGPVVNYNFNSFGVGVALNVAL